MKIIGTVLRDPEGYDKIVYRSNEGMFRAMLDIESIVGVSYVTADQDCEHIEIYCTAPATVIQQQADKYFNLCFGVSPSYL